MSDLFGNWKSENEKDSCKSCSHKENKFKNYQGNGGLKTAILSPFITKEEQADDEFILNYNLKNKLVNEGYSIHKDFWLIKSVNCPLKGIPNKNQLEKCHSNLMRTIKELKEKGLKKIIVLGDLALYSLIACGGGVNGRLKSSFSGGFDNWVNRIIPDQDLELFLIVVENPSFVEWDSRKSIESKLLMENIKKGMNTDIFHKHNYQDDCSFLDEQKAIFFLENIIKNKYKIAIDYETTGLKPYTKGHEIICASVCNGVLSVGFEITEKTKEILLKILKDRQIKKIGQNIKYEHTWTSILWNTKIEGWYWDTLIASHCLDNRSGITGLKFQTYVNFGVKDYDEYADKFLKSNTSNGINDIKRADIEKLCYYCAMDSMFTFRLYEKQKAELSDFQFKGFNFFLRGVLALSDVEQNGIRIDTTNILKTDRELEIKLMNLNKKIQESEEVKKADLWDFNFNSSIQLIELFGKLKYKSDKKTDSGQMSTDAETLKEIAEKYKSEVCDLILQYRKYEKAKNNYLKGFLEEVNNGFIHPFFNLHTVSSFRSSSQNPNFQNYPKRDKEIKEIIRTNIIPTDENYMIVEADYSGVEVSVGCCYHKDQNMINYVKDKTTDMHRDTAADLFLKDSKDITTVERQAGKNGFVFPQFYGDWYKACANNIWEQIEKETKEHLKKKGIYNLSDFEEHTRKIERSFWYERFRDYGKWRDDNWNSYLKTGKLRLKSGFIINNEMDKKQVNNTPIQGTAFHCLLNTLIEFNSVLKKGNYKTKIIGQIHDSIVLDVFKDEWEELKPILKKIMLVDVKEVFPFLVVDLEAEVDYYPKNWNEKEKSEKL